jgi:hypothetical protein
MRKLADIIEDCKLNKRPEYDELRYAVIALTSLMNMSSGKLMRFYKEDTKPIDKLLIDNFYNAYHTALNKSPKDWLGWNNDPENPEYQRFHAIGSKLVDKALNGELPNQKVKRGEGE